MEELLHNFGVDWKLLTAQVVNFAILFVILKKFAYGPIVAMLEERRNRIKQGLEDAAAAGHAKNEATVKRDEIVEAANKKALGIVTEAEGVALDRQAEIVEEAQKKADAVAAAGERKVAEEKAKMLDDVHRGAHELVELAMTRVLGKMSADERDKHLIAEALEELKRVSHKV